MPSPSFGSHDGVAHRQLPSNELEYHEAHGYGSRTSYMYPGGLDLRQQCIPPPPGQVTT
jgi:hypothetical protein